MKDIFLETVFYLCAVFNLTAGLSALTSGDLIGIVPVVAGMIGVSYGLSKLYYTIRGV